MIPFFHRPSYFQCLSHDTASKRCRSETSHGQTKNTWHFSYMFCRKMLLNILEFKNVPYTLPETNSSHLKMDGCKMIVSFSRTMLVLGRVGHFVIRSSSSSTSRYVNPWQRFTPGTGSYSKAAWQNRIIVVYMSPSIRELHSLKLTVCP